MKEKFLDKSMGIIRKYQKIDEGDEKKLRYGLEGLYLTVTKMIVIFLLAFILGIVKEVVLLLVFFNIIRFTGFGFHARKSSECLILSILSFVFLPLLLLNLSLSKDLMLIVGMIGTVYLFLYAPADTVKRPLPNKKKRIIRKVITGSEAVIFTVLALVLHNYTLSILLITAVITEVIMVSPITYKIFKQPYRNYLTYKKA